MTTVAAGSPLAEALSRVIQPKLVEMGWSAEGGDDSALTEYVVLMLVNGKSQEQIAGELSNDLLGLAEGDTQALDFSKWLFGQVKELRKQAGNNDDDAQVGQDEGGGNENANANANANGDANVHENGDHEHGPSVQQPSAIPSVGDERPDEQMSGVTGQGWNSPGRGWGDDSGSTFS